MWESFCISKIGVKASSSGFSGSALRDALLKQLCASLRRQRVGRNINAAPLQFQQKLLGLRHVKADAAQQRLLRENRLRRSVGNDPAPVSYTHLDVYKRQLFAHPQRTLTGKISVIIIEISMKEDTL